MNCPFCGGVAPDANYKCPQCGKILKEIAEPASVRKTETKTSLAKTSRIIFGVIIAASVILAYIIIDKALSTPIPSSETTGRVISKVGDTPVVHIPGTEIEVSTLVKDEGVTIVDFYSEYCPPCRQIAPYLEKLNEKRDDVEVIKININRENVTGIDWESPVIKQYGITSIPFFMIFRDGKRISDGPEASRFVFELLKEENLSR